MLPSSRRGAPDVALLEPERNQRQVCFDGHQAPSAKERQESAVRSTIPPAVYIAQEIALGVPIPTRSRLSCSGTGLQQVVADRRSYGGVRVGRLRSKMVSSSHQSASRVWGAAQSADWPPGPHGLGPRRGLRRGAAGAGPLRSNAHRGRDHARPAVKRRHGQGKESFTFASCSAAVGSMVPPLYEAPAPVKEALDL